MTSKTVLNVKPGKGSHYDALNCMLCAMAREASAYVAWKQQYVPHDLLGGNVCDILDRIGMGEENVVRPMIHNCGRFRGQFHKLSQEWLCLTQFSHNSQKNAATWLVTRRAETRLRCSRLYKKQKKRYILTAAKRETKREPMRMYPAGAVRRGRRGRRGCGRG